MLRGQKLVILAITFALAASTSLSTSHAAKKVTWPAKGFKGSNGVYAKIPTSRALVSLLSANRSLRAAVKACEKSACGAVLVTSEQGCSWWEVRSNVYQTQAEDLSRKLLGSLTTYTTGSKPKKEKTILLLSQERIAVGINVTEIKVICHKTSVNKMDPAQIYLPVGSGS